MDKTSHSPAFKEQALSKARQRGSRTLGSIANELNMSLGTLKGWPSAARVVPREGSVRAPAAAVEPGLLCSERRQRDPAAPGQHRTA